MVLSKETFLKEHARKTVLVDCGLGEQARLRALTESERIEFDVWLKNNKGEVSDAKMRKSRLKLITLCMVDESDNLVLTELDFPEMMTLPASVTAKLASACMKLCGLDDDDLDGEIKN